MISGLLSQLQNQYSLANAPNPAPATGDPNGLSGLLQTTGIPMTENPMGMRTPDYTGLLGMMGQQPFTPGYTGIGGATGAPGQSDYLDRIFGGGNAPQTAAAPSAIQNALVKNPYYRRFTLFADPTFGGNAYLSQGLNQEYITPWVAEQIRLYDTGQGG